MKKSPKSNENQEIGQFFVTFKHVAPLMVQLFNMNMIIENIDFLGGFGETIKMLIKNEVQKRVNEVFEEYDAIRSYEHTTISSDKLCERWGRCKNSLRNLEKEGVITPLPVGGKTKVYSMQDVLNAEMNYPKLKHVA